MASAIQKYLTAPRPPNTAAGFIDDHFAIVDLRRKRRGFSLASSAVTVLPAGLVTPSFDAENINDIKEVVEIVTQTAQAAGLSNKKRWSVALPEGAARTIVVTLESKAQSRRELAEIISWKIERVVGVPASEVRVSRQRISPAAGQERYLVLVGRDEVLSQYENVFNQAGWHAGLLLPRHIGEAQWLTWSGATGDKMLVSSNRTGFTAVVMRNGEPVLVRTYECEPDSRADDIHRFALYYRDKIAGARDAPIAINGLLVLGGLDVFEAQRAVGDALESEPRLLDPAEFGFNLEGEAIGFDQLAGAAGLASLAWQ